MGNITNKELDWGPPVNPRPGRAGASSSRASREDSRPLSPPSVAAAKPEQPSYRPGCGSERPSSTPLDDAGEVQCRSVAKALAESDVFVACLGSGFAADSGLPTCKEIGQVQQYKSRGLGYTGLCDPYLLDTDPSLFYGFWGTCFNDYRWTRPHAGYAILAAWRDKLFSGTSLASALRARQRAWERESEPDEDVEPYKCKSTAGAFFVYTSLADAFAFDFLEGCEVRECQGNVELWQCSNVCTKGVWRAPPNYIFRVDLRNMLASDPPGTNMDTGVQRIRRGSSDEGEKEERKHGKKRKEGTRGDRRLQGLPPWEDSIPNQKMFGRPNRPVCPFCKAHARPNVLMFGDLGFIDNAAQENRWTSWLRAVKEECQQKRSRPLNVMVMEIGAGSTTLPAVRATSQSVAGRLQQAGANVTMVRINPNPSKCTPDGAKGASLKNFIGVPHKGLATLERVNEALQAQLFRRNSGTSSRLGQGKRPPSLAQPSARQLDSW